MLKSLAEAKERLRSELPSTGLLIIGYVSVMWKIHTSLTSHPSPFLSQFEEKMENGKGTGAPYVGIMKGKFSKNYTAAI
jgi:hypothetical protein